MALIRFRGHFDLPRSARVCLRESFSLKEDLDAPKVVSKGSSPGDRAARSGSADALRASIIPRAQHRRQPLRMAECPCFERIRKIVSQPQKSGPQPVPALASLHHFPTAGPAILKRFKTHDRICDGPRKLQIAKKGSIVLIGTHQAKVWIMPIRCAATVASVQAIAYRWLTAARAGVRASLGCFGIGRRGPRPRAVPGLENLRAPA